MTRVTFPHMGSATYSFIELLQDLGNEVIAPKRPSSEILSKGVKLAPEFACVPLKITLGSYVDALERGAEVIVASGGVGPCRAGYYTQIQRRLLRREGYNPEFIVFEPFSKGIGRFISCIKRINHARVGLMGLAALGLRTWEQVKAFDALEKTLHRLRPREVKRGDADALFTTCVAEVAAARDVRHVRDAAQDGIRLMNTVETKPGFQPVQVGIVGEIYVVLEPAANLDCEKMLGEMGAEVRRSMFLSGWTEHNLIHEGGGLDIKAAAHPYFPEMVGGHGQDSVGHTIMYKKAGVDGVVQLAPFTCIPEIVAKSVLSRLSHDIGIPVISFFLDEQTGEAGMRTRLEAFVDLLFRKRKALEAHI
jgi:predicted nucleotide-binding protein (sugar kinase/HSP70/actin superfamily)